MLVHFVANIHLSSLQATRPVVKALRALWRLLCYTGLAALAALSRPHPLAPGPAAIAHRRAVPTGPNPFPSGGAP